MNGLIIAPIFLFYTVVSFFVLYLVFAFLKIDVTKLRNKLLIFFIVITFPFWDLMVQKVIKEVYISSGVLEPKIYAYPEKNENGMIESLSLGDRTPQWFYKKFYDNSINEYVVHEYGHLLKEKIKYLDFVFLFQDKSKIFRFYLKNNQLHYQEMNTEKARYKFVMYPPDRNYWWKLYGVGTEKVIDNLSGKVIAESYGIGFYTRYFFKYLRENILFLVGANGGRLFSVSSYGTRGEMWQKVIVKGEK